MMRTILIAIFLTLSTVPVAAGKIDEALVAKELGDYETAARLFRPLAEQGDAVAQFNLGLLYQWGLGVPRDSAAAVKWYLKAADQGHVFAQMSLAGMYAGNLGEWGAPKDLAESAKWTRRAAEQGNTDAQLMLGSMYQRGEGVAQDVAEAMKWYRRAVEQDDSEGAVRLARMYRHGLGVAQDCAEAVKWYRKAAEQGHAIALFDLGYIYRDGLLGMQQDYVQAHMWFNLAAQEKTPWYHHRVSDANAQKERDAIEQSMTPKEISEAERLARDWMAKYQW